MSEWLSDRVNLTYTEENGGEKHLCTSYKTLRKLGSGGQSGVYNFGNNTVLRTIDLKLQTNCRSEILTNLFLSKVVKENISPHFTITHKLHTCSAERDGAVLQILEKLDGDLTSLHHDRLKKARGSLYPQLLMGLLTLMTNDVRLNDIKPENVLYKILDREVCLCYVVENHTICIVTDVLYVLADYGQAGRYSPDSENDIKNLSDINSVVLTASLSFGDAPRFSVATASSTFFKEFEDPLTGAVCGNPEVTSAQAVFKTFGKSRRRLLTCVKEKIKILAREGVFVDEKDVFGGIQKFTFHPDKILEHVHVEGEDVC